jgi:hypothetical protein
MSCDAKINAKRNEKPRIKIYLELLLLNVQTR